jgi:hypothetical protein
MMILDNKLSKDWNNVMDVKIEIISLDVLIVVEKERFIAEIMMN